MKILLAYDGSDCSEAAIEDLRYAGLPQENDVLVVSVATAGWPNTSSGSDGKTSVREAERLAEQARAHIQFQFPAWRVSSEALWGEPANILHKVILRWMPDLVVVGSLPESVSLDVLHHSACSVRVVRAGLRRPNSSERLLVADDGSPEATAVVDEISQRCWPQGTEVRVVSVAESLMAVVPVLVPALAGGGYASEVSGRVDAPERARLRSVAREAAEGLRGSGLAISVVVLDGDPASEIVAEANRWRADAVFVGARGLGALNRLFLGSVSTAVVAHARCTVEVVR